MKARILNADFLRQANWQAITYHLISWRGLPIIIFLYRISVVNILTCLLIDSCVIVNCELLNNRILYASPGAVYNSVVLLLA